MGSIVGNEDLGSLSGFLFGENAGGKGGLLGVAGATAGIIGGIAGSIGLGLVLQGLMPR